MFPGVGRLIPVLLLVVGCSGGERQDLLVDRAARSVVFAELSSPLSLVTTDIGDRTEVALPFEAREQDLLAFVYERPLAELQIPEGEVSSIAIADCDAEGRPLPPARLELFAEPNERLAWRELGARPAEVEDFRLPPFDVIGCLDGGGCLDRGGCKLACEQETPSIAPPEPPLPGPELEARMECSAGEAHFLGTGACQPIGDACGVGPWPQAVPPSTEQWYVRAGVTSGAGGLDDPFGTIAEALAVAGEGALIVVGAGMYDEALEMGQRRLTMVGACPEETVLRGGLTSAAARLELRNLTLLGRGIEVVNGVLDLERVVLRGPGDVGLSVGPTTIVSLRNVVVEDWEIGAFATAEAELVAEDTLFSSNTTGLSCEGERGAVLLARTALTGDGGALELGLEATKRCRIRVDSVLLESFGGNAAAVASGGALEGGGLVIRGAETGIAADSATVAVERLAISGTAVGLAAARSSVLLADLELAALGAVGLRVDGGNLVAERVRAEEILGPILEASDAALLVRDLAAARASDGLLLDLGEATGFLQRVLLEGTGAHGLSVQSGEIVAHEVTVRRASIAVLTNVPLIIAPARLEENDVGVELPACGLDPARILEGVHFAGNGRRIRRAP